MKSVKTVVKTDWKTRDNRENRAIGLKKGNSYSFFKRHYRFSRFSPVSQSVFTPVFTVFTVFTGLTANASPERVLAGHVAVVIHTVALSDGVAQTHAFALVLRVTLESSKRQTRHN